MQGSKLWSVLLAMIGALLLTMGAMVDTAHAQEYSSAFFFFSRHDAKMVDQVIAYLLMLVALLVTYLIH